MKRSRRYVNNRTAVSIDLSGLTGEEAIFFERAQKYFKENMHWLAFDQFVFGPRSVLYSKTRSHRDVLENPLYQALKDMWLQLGVQQGKVAPVVRRKQKAIA